MKSEGQNRVNYTPPQVRAQDFLLGREGGFDFKNCVIHAVGKTVT
jgi:hypothetical protein